MLNKKGWFDPDVLPLVSAYATSAPSQVLPVAGQARNRQIATAIDRTIHRSERRDPGAPLRSYQLRQPAYATLEEVRLHLGAPAASVLENYLCGGTDSLDGMSADEQRIARAIADIRGVQLP